MADLVPLFGPSEPKEPPKLVPIFDDDLNVGTDIKPDAAARVLRMQYKTGLPVGVISRNLEQVEKQALKEGFDAAEFRKTSPLLAAWMAENPNHAAIVRDDVEGMSAFESALSIPRAIKLGAEQGLKKDRASRELGWKEVIGTITPEEKVERDRLNKELAQDHPRLESGLPSWFKTAADVVGMNVPAYLRSAESAAFAAAPVAGAGFLAGGPALGATAGAGAFAVGATTLFLGEAYKGAVGEAYDDLVTVKDTSGAPLDPTVARYAALVVGVPNAALDTASLGMALKLIPGAGKVIGKITGAQMKQILRRPAVSGALADFSKKYAVAVGTETFTEGLQKFLNIVAREIGQEVSGQEFARDEGDAKAVLAEATAAFKASAVLGLLPAPIKIMETQRDIQVARQNEAFFKALGDASAESKAMKNAPEAVRDFLARSKGSVENIYVQVERFDALFQQDAPQVAAELFGSQAQYLEARTLGADLVIPTEVYAEKVAGTKFHRQLMPDLRLGAGQMTLREAEQQDLERDIERLAAEHEAKFARDAPYRRVYDDILGQAMGAMGRTSAERVALIEAEHYRALGERLGEDALTAYESLKGGLTIRRELPQVLRSMKDVDLDLDPMLDELRTGKSAREQDIYGQSLGDFLRARGGIQDEGGELSALGVDEERRPFVKKLTQENGLSLDHAAEIAAEAGYIPERDINALLDAIDGEARGKPVYSQEAVNQELQTRAQNIKDLGDYLDQAGIDLKTLDNAQVRKRLREASPSADVLEQAVQVETPEFKRWFGDSKVVDADGKPMVVYHGSSADFSEFDHSFMYKGEGASQSGSGFYFTTSRESASGYTGLREGSNVMPVYLALKKPLHIDFRSGEVSGAALTLTPAQVRKIILSVKGIRNKEESPLMDFGDIAYEGFEKVLSEAIRAYAGGSNIAALRNDFFRNDHRAWLRAFSKATGYDSAYSVTDSGATHYVAWFPEQIKSAIGNTGAFDPNDPNIMAQGKARGAYDRATRTITLFKNANPSTIIHELGHDWLEELRHLAGRENAPEQIVDDWRIAAEYLGIDGSEAQIPREAHERWARSAEAYFMEGRAPSEALREVFSRLKDWLVRIYKTVRGLDVELTNEVRGVFDRLLATDEAIAQAEQSQNLQPLLGREGMTDAEALAYLALIDKASTEANDTVRVRALSEFSREHEAWWRNERAIVRETVAAEVNAQPAYRALAWLRTGKLPDGRILEGMEHARLSKTDLERRYGQAFLKRLPFVYQVQGGLHPDVAAGLFGFETGDEMIKAMVEARPKNALIDAETDERMRAEHGDMMNDGTLADKAAAAVQGDRRIDVFMEELRILRRRGAQGEITPMAVLKELARSIVVGKRIEELIPFHYERSAARSAREAEDALLGGDLDGAFEAKQRQALSLLMAREAARHKDNIDADVKRWKAMFKPDERMAKTRNMDMVNAARAIAGLHGIGRAPGKAETYMNQLEAYDPVSYGDMQEIVALATAEPKPYKKLGLADYAIVRDAINGLWEMSRSTRQIELDGRKVQLDDLAQEGIEQLAELTKPGSRAGYEKAVSKADRRSTFFLSRRAHGRRMEHWARSVDRGKKGLFTRLFRQIRGQTVRYREAKVEVFESLIDILRRIDASLTVDKIPAPELNYTFGNDGSGMAELIGALAHRGNPSNFQKLLRGRGWGSWREDGTLDTSKWDAFIARMHAEGVLKKEHYDAIQEIWDLADSLKPGSQEAHKKILGYYFEEVTAVPFDTPFGQYRGGYVPAKVDQFVSDDAALRADQAALEETPLSFVFPTTGRGATKSRVEAYAGPLDLDIRKITRHFDWALRFIHIEPSVREVARLMNHRPLAAALSAVDPEVKTELITPWLVRSAKQLVEVPSASRGGRLLDSFFHKARSHTINQAMVLHVVNVLQQYLGALNSIPVVGASNFRRALFHYMRSPERATQTIIEKDPFMRTRINTSTVELYRTLDDILLNPKPFQKAQEFTKQHGLFLQRGAQSHIDKIIWMAAYDKALSENPSESDAIAAAGSAVRTTQGSGAPEDISAYETGTAASRLLKMYTGYYNAQLNLLVTEGVLAKSIGGVAGLRRGLYVVTVALLLNAFLNEALYRLLSGEGFDDDDDGYLDDFMSMFFFGVTRNAIAMIPVISATPALNVLINQFDDKPFNDRINASPVVSTAESMARTAKLPFQAIAGDDINETRAVRDILTSLGMLTGLPLAPVAKPITYLMDVESGEAKPTGPLDFTRGFVTGKSPQ